MQSKIETATKFFNLMKDALYNGNFTPLQSACKEHGLKLDFSYDDFENKYREMIKRVGADLSQNENETISFTISYCEGEGDKAKIEVSCSSREKKENYYSWCEPYVRIADVISWKQCEAGVRTFQAKLKEVLEEK